MAEQNMNNMADQENKKTLVEEKKDRGIFVRHPKDMRVFLTCDCWRDLGRYVPGDKNYIFDEGGRYNTFPRNSLPYDDDTIRDLARYGFKWVFDNSTLGYVECVYCHVKIEDFDENNLAALEHMVKSPCCATLKEFREKTRNMAKRKKEETRVVTMSNFVYWEFIERGPALNEEFKIKIDYSIGPIEEEDTDSTNAESGRAAEKERLDTLNDFFSEAVPAMDLARYGFRAITCNKQVRCDSCGLVLQNLQHGDRAAIIHAAFSSNCPFMTAKGYVGHHYTTMV